MPTTVDAVKEYLERDIVLHEGLTRGVLNYRRTARWLIEKEGWETTEEAVVSALRRYKPPHLVDFNDAREQLEGAVIEAETGLVIITLPHIEEIVDRLPNAWAILETEQMFAVLPGRKHLRIITEEKRLPEIQNMLKTEKQDHLRRVACLRVRLPEDGPSAMISVSTLIHALAYRDKHVLGVFTCGPESVLMIPSNQFSSAYRLASQLTKSTS